jgi:broad specificity phosphatase PhoE/phage gp29-like protein
MYTKHFSESKPSYLDANTATSSSASGFQPYAPIEDTTYDPRFKVTSKKPYEGSIVNRALVWDYYRTQLALPNDSDVLVKLGKNIEEVDQLLCDARVKAAFNNRRSGTLSLKWTVDQNDAPTRMYNTICKMFDQFPIYDVMSEMLMASFYGYAVTEVVWEPKNSLWIPTTLEGKAQRWFVYSDKNELRVKSKVEQVQGERLPPRKFIVSRFHPRYDDPYAGREALFNACYWPVIFRKSIMQYIMQFLDKYGMPWFDVTVEGGLQQERLQEIVGAINQTYQDGILAHPDNTKLEKIDMGDGKTVANYLDALDMLNREIDTSILGNNLSVEVKGGSFAAATAHMGVRDDIIQEDSRMIEESLNQLIEWIAWYNWGNVDTLPKFRLYKNYPPTKERAEIDVMISKLGVKLSKSYFARTYGLNQDEFEIGAPQPDLNTGIKGAVAGAVDEPTEQKSDTIAPSASSSDITEAGIEAKDQASNSPTTDAILKIQGKGYSFAEGSKMMILVRHGETNQNGNSNTDRIRGWHNVQLNDKGRAQATALGKKLNGKIDIIVSSDLDRASDTADDIAKETGAPVVKTKALRPWDVGKYTGMHSKEVQGDMKQYVNNPEKPIPEGESFNTFRSRALGYIKSLPEQYPGKRIAIVTHHRLDRLTKAWDKAGNKEDLTIDKDTFLTRGNLEPGQERDL